MVFEAVAEGPADTKAVLDGQLGDAIRQIVWEPGDEVGMATDLYYNTLSKFTNIEKESSNLASFEGEANYAWSHVYALYPYKEGMSSDYYKLSFTIPSEQKYYPGSFAHGAMPMVAKGNYGETLQFKALCGALALNLVGEGSVKSVTFMAYDASGTPVNIAGRYWVDINYDKDPEVSQRDSLTNVITLNCPDGVVLDSTTPTPFYIVLPVGTYDSFRVVIAMEDGKMMFKEGKNPLTIKRANVTKTGSLPFVEVETVDVSLTGRSNCYQITDAGIYSFDATVMGNGEFGLVENVDFHTKNPTISPVTAEVIWQDRNGVISGVACDGERISFIANGTKGNALIAAKDDNGKILWSWHIWVTEQPEDQIYINDRGSFTMQDRNLGAIRAERGSDENWRQSVGTFYQWGRKDPFNENVGYEEISSQVTVAESILYPTTFISEWNGWCKEQSDTLWSGRQKTIYDPCPVGYRVPVKDVWYGFTADGAYADRVSSMNVSGQYNNGWNFIYDGVNTTWYPTSDWSYGRYFSSTKNSSLEFYYYIDMDCYINPSQYHQGYYKYNIRCMKDEGHVDTSYPTVKITGVDVTAETADVVANVTDQGISEITERGILWGLTSDLTVDNAIKVVAETAGDGEYTIKLNGLQHATVYYVRPYAVNERGFSYGKVTSFRTTYAGAANDLSAYGTSNCYQVEPAYCKHYVNGSVKGSGYESIGAVASVEVLWETNGIGYRTEPGTVIFDVTLKDGNIYFYTNGVEGNALIASKDALGNILWSWHIWVTDTPEEQPYGYYWLLDRNLGAVSAEEGTGEQWKLSCGLEYQWGRKDPFAAGTFTEDYAYYSVESSIANPTVYDAGWSREDYYWSPSGKTVYDPCPVGYRMPVSSVWNGISMKTTADNHGTYFYFDSNPSATYWYPYESLHYPTYISYNDSGRLFAAIYADSFYWFDGGYFYASHPGAHVRCMKDEGYVDMSYPLVEMTSIKDITSTGAKLYAEITNTGIAEITSKGFIWGTSADLSLENGTKIECGSGSEKFNASLTGLAHSVMYYVRAYATNERGTTYSDVKTFYTPFEGNAVNLSRNGTANCYIVPVAYSDYVFDASVKGNSKESVGAIASAEVLWETRNTTYALEVTSVIESVELEGNNVKFRLPFDPKPGNALIAVKDANGTVLWSWHIWVVDYDPVATQQKYISGAIMMDRNLGALSVIPSPSTAENYEAYGLYYQWGRKDPFTRTYTALAPSNAITAVTQDVDSIEATIANPTVVYDDTNWGYDSTLWGVSKTKYDPCPYGWRVPDKNVWDGISNEYLQNASSTHRIIPEPYSTPQAYYPMAGCVDGYDGQWTNSFNDTGYWWTTSRAEKLQAHWYDHFYVSYDSVDYRMSVRCMKEAGNIKPGAGNDYIVDDEYEW